MRLSSIFEKFGFGLRLYKDCYPYFSGGWVVGEWVFGLWVVSKAKQAVRIKYGEDMLPFLRKSLSESLSEAPPQGNVAQRSYGVLS